MMLDLTPLTNALKTLKEALVEYDKDRRNDFVRDSCIQRFEYCYELSWKMLKRHMEMTSGSSPAIDHLAFPDLIRAAAEQGLLKNSWDVWEKFRKARNQTSHTYDAGIAAEVMAVIPSFYEEASALHAVLEERNV